MGVCTAWCSGDDLRSASVKLAELDAELDLDEYAMAASDLLWMAAGRRYPGLCVRTVRPCGDGACGAFGVIQGSNYVVGWGGRRWRYSDPTSGCSCGYVPKILLSGKPRQVCEVIISGETLDSDRYRLDGQWLVRMDGEGWPLCQDLAADDDGPGAFSVRYQWGTAPSGAARLAAVELGVQLALQGIGDKTGNKNLSTFAITQIARQGVTMNRQVLTKLLGGSGLPTVDAFLSTVNPTGRIQQAAVWSPDIRRPAGRV